MRRNVILVFVLGLLFFGLAASEYPELRSLSDNPTNDFAELEVDHSDLRVLASARQEIPTTPRVPVSFGKKRTDQIQSPVLIHPSRDSLDLYCILRT
jgi:hypothetical protein